MTPTFHQRRTAAVAALRPAGAALGAAWLLSACSLLNQELPNEPPVVQVSEAEPTRVKRGGSVSLQVTASDEDDDPLSYAWDSFGAGSFTDPRRSATTWIAPEAIEGHSELFLLQVTIADNQPETEDPVQSFLIEVVQRPPVLTAAPGDTLVPFRLPLLTLEASASDEDGDALSFLWDLGQGARAQLAPRDVAPGLSQARVRPLVPETLLVTVAATDGPDTVTAQLEVRVEAPALPEGGMVALDLPLVGGGTRRYEIDTYEYPGQRGTEPQRVDDWFQASALCAAQGKRLCTSAEWRFACQGPEGNRFSSSDDRDDLPAEFGLRFCNETGSDLAGSAEEGPLAPSGSFPNCSSSTGVYDMTGNAFEWMMDIDIQRGRQGRWSFSGSDFPRQACDAIDTPQPPVPFADEFDDTDRARIDSLRARPDLAGYFFSGRGFRCCR